MREKILATHDSLHVYQNNICATLTYLNTEPIISIIHTTFTSLVDDNTSMKMNLTSMFDITLTQTPMK